MSPARLRVAVVGAAGRLGSFAVALLRARSDFEVVACYDARDPWSEQVAGSGAQVALEATRAGLGGAHGQALLAAGVRPVIATSGVSEEELRSLDAEARRRALGGLVVPNFSLGSLLLQRFAAQAARHFAAVEIIELHHERKADAPSGTAIETARRIAAEAPRTSASAQQAGLPAARGGLHSGVPVHSVRLPGLYAHQQVLLGSAGETLSLRHDMSGPEAFGPGILAALRFAAGAVGVARGLEQALEPARTGEEA